MTASKSHDLPAIAGGTPAKIGPYAREQRYGEAELVQLREALEQNTLFYSQGRKVKEMEAAFAALIGAKYAIACSSGTAAIHAAMMAAGISPGEEVILAPITDMGSVIPILWQGGVPVFADVDPHTYEISPESVEERLTERTRAVLAIHLWGNSCDLNALREICDRRGLTLIEDAAQAHGCTYDGKPVGTVGEMGCFSLNEFKHIACGDGGVVVTDDEHLAHILRLSTDKCYDRSAGASARNATFLAANYRMTELQGAVALAQLGKLENIVERRRAIGDAMASRLAGIPGVSLPRVTEGCNPSWWFYMLRVDGDADHFAEALQDEGLPAYAHYIGRPIYEYPLFAQHSAFARGVHPFAAFDYHRGLCPQAEAVLDSAVIVAINEAYTQADLDETITGISKVARWLHTGA
jgi:perosamine synthetase